MISVDTNILLPAVETTNPAHPKAAAFLESLQDRDDVAVSEFILLELYVLLRNPAVLAKPLAPGTATDVCEAFRQHPRWQVIGFPSESRTFHDRFWPRLRETDFARRRAYDWRAALVLLQSGVTDFATVNEKDFREFGFKRVWNPLLQV
ncbi:MAG: VapC toxin family PIN domain ribonuclease [Verrucomicrobiaceae bacterium]|nr:MAG: VapC toxin family PIN domain ribonuclease [Verrucomicrobiaceae bacterium]